MARALKFPAERLREIGDGDDACEALQSGFSGAIVCGRRGCVVVGACEELARRDADQFCESGDESERKLLVVGAVFEATDGAGADSERARSDVWSSRLASAGVGLRPRRAALRRGGAACLRLPGAGGPRPRLRALLGAQGLEGEAAAVHPVAVLLGGGC